MDNKNENRRVVVTVDAKSKAEALDCLKKALRDIRNADRKAIQIQTQVSVPDKEEAE